MSQATALNDNTTGYEGALITAPDLSNRNLRQRDLVPPARLADVHALVIGVGAIGRQVALQLAALGVPALTVMDDDRVGVENLAAQGYRPADLGQLKTTATLDLVHQLNPAIVTTDLQRPLVVRQGRPRHRSACHPPGVSDCRRRVLRIELHPHTCAASWASTPLPRWSTDGLDLPCTHLREACRNMQRPGDLILTAF